MSDSLSTCVISRLTPLFSGVSGVATLEDKDGDESVSGGGVAGLCSRSVVPSLETLESLMLSQVNCLEEQGCDWLSLIGVLLFFLPLNQCYGCFV